MSRGGHEGRPLSFRTVQYAAAILRTALNDAVRTGLAGVPVIVVSERLGHSSLSLTLDVYRHVLPSMEADAMERFTSHLYGSES